MEEKQGPPSYDEASQYPQGISNVAYSGPDGPSYPQSNPLQQSGSAAPYNTSQPRHQPQIQVEAYGQNPTVFTNQQPHMVMGYAHVPDNMGLAIFATLCCCWPIGIFAIMKASESRAALSRQDIPSAMASANESKRLSFISMASGFAFLVSFTVVLVVVLTTSITNN